MRIQTMIPALTLTLIYAMPATAQTPGPVTSPNPGVTPVRQIDRAEVRVTRVELQPGAVRSVHAHDDVGYSRSSCVRVAHIEVGNCSDKRVDRPRGLLWDGA
jgi:hypothetical protein